ncbi:MAG TPA: serine hydrolase [Hyphomicrobiaceae bacterium]|nr:serine hydrolase [Hyphomicrobiaceae bacterium]
MHPAPTQDNRPDDYVPDAASWAHLSAADAGFDGARLAAAVEFALAHDSPWPQSLYYADGRYVGNVEWNETGPWSEIVGPVLPRGGPAGVVLKGGRILAEWGDTGRPDMTFSVAKSYLAVLTGLGVADGCIADVDEPVGATVKGPWFASQHNARVTWRHLLQQSSEWQGELWGKSDQVDHNRQTGAGADQSRKGQRRELMAPGTHFEYNDVRVNLLAFCLLQRFGRALPDVLRERIMNPIGASRTWEWHGYSTSWTEIGGRSVQSVAGGGHWGGGMIISARDHARLGLLMARAGRWGGRQVLPTSWVKDTFSPSPTNPGYGFLWWLNAGAARRPAASPASVFAVGAGNHMIWIDPDHDLVTVLRWIDGAAIGGFMARLMAATNQLPTDLRGHP